MEPQGVNPKTVSKKLSCFNTSQKITDRPRNTHSRGDSKCEEKGVPPIFKCLHGISLHNTAHAVIKGTSGN